MSSKNEVNYEEQKGAEIVALANVKKEVYGIVEEMNLFSGLEVKDEKYISKHPFSNKAKGLSENNYDVTLSSSASKILNLQKIKKEITEEINKIEQKDLLNKFIANTININDQTDYEAIRRK